VLKDLPAGSYVLNLDLRIRQQSGDPQPFDAECGLETPTRRIQHWDGAEVPAGRQWSMSFTRTVTLSSPASVSLKCYASTKRYGTSGVPVVFQRQYLTATRVSKVTQTTWPR
jgi:hypothetical protein